MFTGIVDHCGELLSIQDIPSGCALTIATQFQDLQLGESIAVDGVCLTVTASEQQSFCCECSPETLNLTIIDDYQRGRLINLERALAVGDRLGGHWVSGHVDARLKVHAIKPHHDFMEIVLAGCAPHTKPWLVAKGSVTINGVSLTINAVTADGFSICMIPHTAERTNLSRLKIGDWVNIEYDQMAKLVANQVQHYLAASAIEG